MTILQSGKLSLRVWILLGAVCLALPACDVIVEAAQGNPEPSPYPSITPTEVRSQESVVDPTVTPTLAPQAWMKLPVVPKVSETARQIYRRGFEMGNDPHAFSKVGDCQNVPSMFMAPFDDPKQYSLGEEYAELQRTIDWFAGSFERESQAVRRGFNAASVVSPLWADPDFCESQETPLECELRIHRPVIAIISLETWWEKGAESYEVYLRQILETAIEHGVVPIVSTKADNLEGDHSINATLVRLAHEYDIPLWNFWKAVQPLPDHGLLEDGFHLTFAANYFDDPQRMQAAWPWRNLTALQALDAVWWGISSPQR